jgi:hypothetical protein
MVPSHRKVRSGRDEFRETLTVGADGNPEPSRRYTAGRCRDYLSAEGALNNRHERPAPHWGEEIVRSLRKRRGQSESLGPRFESERAHQFSMFGDDRQRSGRDGIRVKTLEKQVYRTRIGLQMMVANDCRGSGAAGYFGSNFGGNSKCAI